jgi:hypothetical protein
MTTKLQVRVQAAGELACRPGSVHPLARAGGHPSGTTVTAASCGLPASIGPAALKHADCGIGSRPRARRDY